MRCSGNTKKKYDVGLGRQRRFAVRVIGLGRQRGFAVGSNKQEQRTRAEA
jgi:hypothetical protein